MPHRTYLIAAVIKHIFCFRWIKTHSAIFSWAVIGSVFFSCYGVAALMLSEGWRLQEPLLQWMGVAYFFFGTSLAIILWCIFNPPPDDDDGEDDDDPNPDISPPPCGYDPGRRQDNGSRRLRQRRGNCRPRPRIHY